ncbi:MAG: response regulator transcription factor [Candidatus Krumholzibacteriia bacterium]
MKILIVEDDKGIVDFLAKGLKAEGYVVRTAPDGETGSAIGCAEDIDMAIIDVVLPGKGGHEVLDDIRAKSPDLPVIMLSVVAETDSKLRAFGRGAVDYITKPFDFDELLARVRVHMKRNERDRGDLLTAGKWQLDLTYRELRCEGKVIKLTAREFSILEYLFRNKGKVLSRAQILSHVWDYNFDPQSNIVDVYIRFLREKLAVIDGGAEIETVRGMGYRLKELE